MTNRRRNTAGGLTLITLYAGLYLTLRPFPSRYAPYAFGRPWDVPVTSSRIQWPVFRSRIPHRHSALLHEFLEPAAYYFFAPLVEADLTFNGHPADPSHRWEFFGDNYD